jgi:MerR family copper efflux transcriptional regulator
MKELTIGKIAKATDIGIETIRFYEKKGLLGEPLRRPSGYRIYGDKDILRLRFIRRAKDLGFTLKEIKELLELRDKHEKKKPVLRLAKGKISDIEGKISSLKKMKHALESLTSSCDHGRLDEKCPLLSALDEN